MPEQKTANGIRELVRVAAGAPTAPYSAAVIVGDLVYTSGALPVEADGTTSDDFATQVRTALNNLADFLGQAGAGWDSVIKVNGYVADIEQLPVLNEVYSQIVCSGGKPARTTVEVSRFRGKTLVEFDAVALRTA